MSYKRQCAFILIGFLLLLNIGCSTTKQKKIEYLPLNTAELNAIQISYFSGSKEDVFKATRATLEDQGYLINSVDYNSGYIGASSPDILVNADLAPQDNYIQVHINAVDRSFIYGVVNTPSEASRYGIPYVGGLFSLWDSAFHRKEPLTKRDDGVIEDAALYQNLFNQIADELEQPGVEEDVNAAEVHQDG